MLFSYDIYTRGFLAYEGEYYIIIETPRNHHHNHIHHKNAIINSEVKQQPKKTCLVFQPAVTTTVLRYPSSAMLKKSDLSYRNAHQSAIIYFESVQSSKAAKPQKTKWEKSQSCTKTV
ncbi:hypothetical protein BaRGS_00005781 [Batillaria attramentaria]|uniref:Uncharacterized protein n=1 Tax=Batillaria attramentaria TaxID=370345 RepID=A0ABD0LUE4_9CAEN